MDTKSLSIIQKVIIGIIAVIAAFFYISIMKNEEAGGAINGMLYFTYFVLGVTLLGTILVWFKDILMHPKKLKQTGIFDALFLLIVVIARYFASDKGVRYSNGLEIDANTSKWVDTGLFTFYILAAVAILLMFLSPVLPMIGGKNNNEVVEEEIIENEE
jgi:uncharacterized membrane protein YhaH (DUF805 family)